MKKITLGVLALFVAALSFNVAAQDNVEKVKERIMPLIDGKVSIPEQDELFNSLVFADGKLISLKYDVLESNLSAAEFDNVLLVVSESKAAIVIKGRQSRRIGTEIPSGIELPVTVISIDRHSEPYRFQTRECDNHPRFLCIRHQIIIAE